MPTTQTLIAFIAVSTVIMVTPGPSNLFILAQGISQGRRLALTAVCGIETAAAIRLLATIFGLAALLNSSTTVLDVIRWGGAAYLTYLGLMSLRPATTAPPTETTSTVADASSHSHARTVRKALAVGIANPKMLIFYVSFLPQFIHPGSGSPTIQIIILGSIFWILGVVWDVTLACASGPIGSWIRARPQAQTMQLKAEALVYLALAAWIVITGG